MWIEVWWNVREDSPTLLEHILPRLGEDLGDDGGLVVTLLSCVVPAGVKATVDGRPYLQLLELARKWFCGEGEDSTLVLTVHLNLVVVVVDLDAHLNGHIVEAGP